MLHDIEYALRQVRRAPGFTLIAVLTLALGTGANTALFSLADAVILSARPGVNAQGLAWIVPVNERGRPSSMSYPDYIAYRELRGVFEDVASYTTTRLAIADASGSEIVRGQVATGNLFSVLHTPMAIGRPFLPDDDRTFGTGALAVISHSLWQRRYAGGHDVIGRSLSINGQPFTIVGVATAGFNGADLEEQRDVWVPMSMVGVAIPGTRDPRQQSGYWFLETIGRLSSGVSLSQANVAARTVAERIVQTDPQGHARMTVSVTSAEGGLPPSARGDVIPLVMLSLAVTGIILLIACANVSNLLLGRAVARRREIGIRLSLGASRWRVVRQLLVESLLLAAIGSVAGFICAVWVADYLIASAVIPVPLELDLVRPFVFALAIAVASGVLFGLAPALHATRSDLQATVKGVSRQAQRRSRLQGAFVIAQVALSLLLLVTAGLFLRAFDKANRLDLGFDASSSVLAMSFDLGLQNYSDARAESFIRELSARARGMPGVEQVSFTNLIPMGSRLIATVIEREADAGAARAADEHGPMANVFESTVRPGYFSTIGIPLLRGRDFSTADREGAPEVVIVSEGVAARFWPGQNPIGKRVSFGEPTGPFFTVIGVAREALTAGLEERWRSGVYRPQLQRPVTKDLTLLVRVRGDATPLAAPLRDAIHALDPSIPLQQVQTLAQYKRQKLQDRRTGSAILGVFGALALMLASIGLYGVMSFVVRQRTREIGIRIALGAVQHQVVRLFVRDGLRLTMVGLGIGLVLSLAVTRLLGAMLVGISPSDALTFGGVAMLLAAVALLACWLPSRRAARVDPMEALRLE
jgi:predicted permease